MTRQLSWPQFRRARSDGHVNRGSCAAVMVTLTEAVVLQWQLCCSGSCAAVAVVLQ
jgi:hypothetical protein